MLIATCGANGNRNNRPPDLAESIRKRADVLGAHPRGRYLKTLGAGEARFIPCCATVARLDVFMMTERGDRLSLSERILWDKFAIAQGGDDAESDDSDAEIVAIDAVFSAMVTDNKTCKEAIDDLY